MKKFLCMILAIGMVCASATFVGCKKNKNKGGNPQSSSQQDNGGDNGDFIQSDDNVVVAPEGGAEWGDW